MQCYESSPNDGYVRVKIYTFFFFFFFLLLLHLVDGSGIEKSIKFFDIFSVLIQENRGFSGPDPSSSCAEQRIRRD
jgi:hypothetical protein